MTLWSLIQKPLMLEYCNSFSVVVLMRTIVNSLSLTRDTFGKCPVPRAPAAASQSLSAAPHSLIISGGLARCMPPLVLNYHWEYGFTSARQQRAHSVDTCIDCTMAFKFSFVVAVLCLVAVACMSFIEKSLPVSKGCIVSKALSHNSSAHHSNCSCSRAGIHHSDMSNPASVPGITSALESAAGAKEVLGSKIAVCLLGEIALETFAPIFEKHKTTLVDKLNATIFLSTFQRRWRANKQWCDAHPGDVLWYGRSCDHIQKSGGDDWLDLIQRVESVLPLQGWNVHTRYSSQQDCPPGTVDEIQHFGQHERMRDCADMIRRDESITGKRYDWVMKVRSDTWTEGWPPLEELIPKLQITKAYIHGFRDPGCPHDHFVLYHRSHLEALSVLLAQGNNECQPASAFAGSTMSECNFGVILNRYFKEGPSLIPWSGIEGIVGLSKREHLCPSGRSCSFP